MTNMHYLGIGMVIMLIAGISICSGRKVKTVDDFEGGRSSSAGLVMCAFISTIVGGASTIGTAQLAYTNGLSAIWFPLGSAAGLILMALFFITPLYHSGTRTLPQFLAREYGMGSGTVTALLSALGSMLSIVSQILSGVALIMAMSRLSALTAIIVVTLLMLVYVVFGGILGAGYVGIIKIILLCFSIGICGILAIKWAGGFQALRYSAELPHAQYFNVFSRGIWTDLGTGLAAILGVVSTQVYMSTALSARNLRTSKVGALSCAALIPLISFAGIAVGMYMRVNFPGIDTKMALPLFIVESLPPLAAGVMLATLLIAIVGSGAGLALGVSSVLCRDIYCVYRNQSATSKTSLGISRILLIVVLILCALCSIGNIGDLIQNWTVMSRGLRAAVAFVPICTAIYLPGKISGKYAVAAMIAGPVFTFASSFFLGMVAAVVVMSAGYLVGNQ